MTESLEKENQKHSGKKVLLLFTVCLMVFSASTVYAAKAGFVKKNGNTYYRKADSTYAKGWMKLNGKKYYFDKSSGIMVTGWRTNKSTGQKRYFHSSGYMVTGWTKELRYFDPSTGYMYTGWNQIDGNKYYFWPKDGITATGWVKNPSGKYRYFSSKGVMLTGWTESLQYFDPDSGIMLTGWNKVDGHTYYFQSPGGKAVTGWYTENKKTYYFNNHGSRQTGWTAVDGKYYYFSKKNGQMLKDTTQDGIKLGADGAAFASKKEKKTLAAWANSAKILILSGHGMGDSGAVSKIGGKNYREADLTREFAKLIYGYLSETKLRVTLYDQNYDLYQIISGKKQGPMPNLKEYDYVLEIHFNAMANPDLKGNGRFMGCGMMVNSKKKKISIDQEIIVALAKTGFAIWGREDGIFRSSGLTNAKTCQGLKVSYGLLETAFIDDKDDMTFYNKYKKKMAKAVSDAIESHYLKLS